MAKKTLIVYYSFEGNVDYVAGEVRRYLRLAMQKLVPEEEPPKSALKKFLIGGKDALTKKEVKLKTLQYRPEDYDTVIIACPVWAGTYPPAIAAFLKQYPFSGKDVYLIGASAGGNASKMFEKLKGELSGNTVKDTLSLKSPLKNKQAVTEQVGDFCRKNGL